VTVSGIDATLTLPVANVASILTETISTTPPGSVPALSIARAAQNTRSAQADNISAIVYLQVTDAATVTLSGIPGVRFTLPTSTAGLSYELASYDGTAWNDDYEGPFAGSGDTVTVPLGSGTTTISPAAPLELALYVATTGSSPSPGGSPSPPSGSPTPSPAASPSPSPAVSSNPSPNPSAVPLASPGSLVFDASSPSSQTLTVTETGDTAAFNAAIVCSAASPAPSPAPSADFVAQITPASAAPSGATPATFTVTGGNLLGTCTITITDVNGAIATVPVAVDQTNATISTTHRKH
jgi:hypothetical protein